ncbi:hypothetical protein FIBSPDRAFT_904412 [Athelia psychrophila]|uniref:Uncharacterized protein n=1 Tax=Athelia psychrophila TaxID=1759441 RepID=A0A167USS7_9AGAM|nr:hypothetical protein FIBSPDRAFT_904412 [Fibularhizoctonia sp. CBS 109695]
MFTLSPPLHLFLYSCVTSLFEQLELQGAFNQRWATLPGPAQPSIRVHRGDIEGREWEREEEAEGGVAEELAEARGEGVYERVVEGREPGVAALGFARRVGALDVLARAALAPVLPPLVPVVVRLPLGAVRIARLAALVRLAQLLHAAPPEAPQAERVAVRLRPPPLDALPHERVRELGLLVGVVLPVDVLAALVVARAQVRAPAHVRVVERVAAARARAQRAAAVPPELEERADDVAPRHGVVRAPQRVARVPLALLVVRGALARRRLPGLGPLHAPPHVVELPGRLLRPAPHPLLRLPPLQRPDVAPLHPPLPPLPEPPLLPPQPLTKLTKPPLTPPPPTQPLPPQPGTAKLKAPTVTPEQLAVPTSTSSAPDAPTARGLALTRADAGPSSRLALLLLLPPAATVLRSSSGFNTCAQRPGVQRQKLKKTFARTELGGTIMRGTA